MVRVSQRKKKKLQPPATRTFQTSIPIVAPLVAPSINEVPATTLVLEQPMIWSRGFLPTTTFQAFVANIAPPVAPSSNTVAMLGFAVFSTLRGHTANSSTYQTVDLDKNESTAGTTGVIEPIGATLGDVALDDFLSPPRETALPSLTPRLASSGEHFSLKIDSDYLFYLLAINFYLFVFQVVEL